MNMKDKVWFITGCSTGFGRELSLMALEQGYRVAVAARNIDDVKDIISKYKEKAVAIKLDMTNPAEIESSVKKVIEVFGRIDLLVNNAGIGYFASMEESEEKEVRRMFEVNFFGLTKLTQLVLPQMRKQKSGHIINVSSIGGIVGYPAVSFYNATKFAVAGLSEALAKETAHLGIKVTIVCPSGFRTDWAGRSANENAVLIEDYKETAGANASNIRGYSGKQAGDPVRAAKEIITMSESTEPPLYLLLGTAAYNNAKKKLQEMEINFDKWKDSSINADFPK
jgi:NAD(P)-dependent dehydrogenase (short-subunit alcohol dehydrogenase family)